MPQPPRTGAHVLVLVENLSVPFDRRVWQESRALTAAGHRVDVICPMGTNRDTEAFAEIEGVRIHRYPLRAATGGPAGYPREYGAALWHTIRIARRLQKQDPFDVIHACNPPDLLFLVALALRGKGARFLFDHHDLVPELFLSRFEGGPKALYHVARMLERATFRTADAVISTNDSYRSVAIERGKLPPDRVSVVRSAPDLGRFQAVPPDPALRRGRAHLACYLGVMGPQDGVDYALRALAHLRDTLGRDDVHAVFMGGGDAFDESVALTRELGLDDRVEFTGLADDRTISAYLSTADVCIAPDPKNPLNDLCSMNKVVEYMALGKAVVVPGTQNFLDMVDEGVNGVTFRDGDAADLERVLGSLCNHRSRCVELGLGARQKVEYRLNWRWNAVEVCRLFSEERVTATTAVSASSVVTER